VLRRPALSTQQLWILRTGMLVCSGVLCAFSLYLFGQHMWHGAITGDWPWIWRTGQWITHHGLPSTDLYSWTFPGRNWVLYQWLFEVAMAALYSIAGPDGSVMALCVFAVVIYVLIPTAIHARRGVPVALSLTLGSLVLLPVSINLGLRPMLASCLALLLQFVLVHRLRRGTLSLKPACAAIAAVYLVWANMHLGVAMGLVSLSLFATGDTLDRWRDQEFVADWRSYAWLTGAALAGSLVNPYGWHIYSYIAELSLESAMNAHIHELMPPDASNRYVATGIALLALALVQSWRRPGRLAAGDGLHVLLFAIATAHSVRFVVWVGLFYALVIPGLWANDRPDHEPTPAARAASVRILALYSVLALAMIGALLPWRLGAVRMANCAPLAGGIRYLDQHYRPDTHWFSSEIVGSCTRLYAPQRRVFIDTRFDMYPENFVLRWYHAYQHRDDWQRLFDHWRIRLVLLANGAPLLPLLEHNARFRQVWHDRHTHLFELRLKVDSNAPGSENNASLLIRDPEALH
jgi:hypothetical protein